VLAQRRRVADEEWPILVKRIETLGKLRTVPDEFR
jgi:hypothetical protein